MGFLFCATEISDAFKYAFKEQSTKRVPVSWGGDAMEALQLVPRPLCTVATAKAAFAKETRRVPKTSFHPGTPKGCGVRTSGWCLLAGNRALCAAHGAPWPGLGLENAFNAAGAVGVSCSCCSGVSLWSLEQGCCPGSRLLQHSLPLCRKWSQPSKHR